MKRGAWRSSKARNTSSSEAEKKAFEMALGEELYEIQMETTIREKIKSSLRASAKALAEVHHVEWKEAQRVANQLLALQGLL